MTSTELRPRESGSRLLAGREMPLSPTRPARSGKVNVLTKRKVTILSHPTTKGRDKRKTVDSSQQSDLPLLSQAKDAITRSALNNGVNYVLPVDKGKNSVENIYRTDLRYIFREPYRHLIQSNNTSQLDASVKHHFKPNNPPAPFVISKDDYTKYGLNSESEKVRAQYSSSAPPRGITGKLTTANSPELKTRSNLYLPLKSKLPPEALRMKAEAERILRTVQEDAVDEAEAQKMEVAIQSRSRSRPVDADDKAMMLRASPGDQTVATYPMTTTTKASRTSNLLTAKRVSFGSKDLPAFPRTTVLLHRKALPRTYEELKKQTTKETPAMPDNARSPYLSEEKNLDIWNWLSKGEVDTEFTRFMSICN